MSLLDAGYWPTTYWASSYWAVDYWPSHGVAPDFTIRIAHWRNSINITVEV